MSNGSWLNPLSQAQSDTRSLYGGPEVHKMNLWTFESLNGVQSTLKDSINTVSEAKEALKAQIEDVRYLPSRPVPSPLLVLPSPLLRGWKATVVRNETQQRRYRARGSETGI